jgi:D-alanyl-D-alanine carboxypeptidase
MRALIVAIVSLLFATATIAQTSRATPPSITSGSGKPFHLPYSDAKSSDMDEVAPALRVKDTCRLQKAALGPIKAMMEAANGAAKDGWELKVTSCFRDANYQAGLFCDKDYAPAGKDCVDPDERAKVSAPPNHSEHETGYTVDFVVRARAGAAPLKEGCGREPCEAIKSTDVGRWLLRCARNYDFELSFPENNAQNVMYEPWHWRWVGSDDARRIFGPARSSFPANPAVDGTLASCDAKK